MDKEKLSDLLDSIYELEGLVHLALARDDNPAGLSALIAEKAAAVAGRCAAMADRPVPEQTAVSAPVEPTVTAAAPTTEETKSVPVAASPAASEPETAEDEDYVEDGSADSYEEEEDTDTLYVAPDDEEENEEDNEEDTEEPEEKDNTDDDTEEVTEEEEEDIELPSMEEALGFRPDPDTLRTAPVRRSINDEAEGSRRSLNDVTARGRLVFSLNDRFRFRRSLFKGDDMQFTAALGEVAALENYYEAEDYFYGTLQWQPDNQEVVDFMRIIQRYFES